ncbi:MAG: flagellar filament capping protein FliD [Betaproteobacteria bacterium]
MEVSQVNSGTSLYASSVQADRISEAVKKPLERLDQKVESTKVRLSTYGQMKSADEQVQQAAKALQEASGQGSFEAVKKATQSFVDAVNKQQGVANQASTDDRNASERTQASDSRLRLAASEMRRAVQGNNGSNLPDLKQAGITVAKDGSVNFDAKQLEKAYQADPSKLAETLNRAAKETSAAATRQVSSNDGVGASVDRMKEQLRNLEQNRANYQAQLESAQRTVDQRNQQVEQARAQTQQAFGFGGVSAYKGVLSF